MPIILASLDGIVNDIAKKNRGFFAEDIEIELQAWNSISAHSEGLGKLVNVLQTSRKKTSTEEIKIPFRHGILHGRDLNFDNKIIAAKSWAALFSIRDWVLAVKHDREPQEKEDFSFNELQEQIQETQNTKQAIKDWEPRKKEKIQQIIENENYKKGTPESKVAEFMKAWEDNNFGAMFDILPKQIQNLKRRSTEAGRMRERFEDHSFLDFEILEIDEFAPASCKIKTVVEFDFNGTHHKNEVTHQLLFQDENGDTAISRIQGGQWGFYPRIY